MRYKSQKQVKNFIKSIATDPIADLSAYTDPVFVANLQLMALEDMHYLLNRIIHTKPLDIPKLINNQYPETKFNLIDYCAIAGFDEMAEKLLALGAKSAYVDNLDKIFSDKFGRESSDSADEPDIVNDIQETIGIIKAEQQQDNIKAPAPSMIADSWQQIKATCMQHKIPAFFFILGLSCSLASPAAPAATGTILLLSFGIPSILAGLKFCQDAYKARVELERTEAQKHMAEQEQDLKELIKSVEEKKRAIKAELKTKGVRTSTSSSKNKEPIVHQDSEQILFDFNKKTEAHGGEDNHGAAAMRLKFKPLDDWTI